MTPRTSTSKVSLHAGARPRVLQFPALLATLALLAFYRRLVEPRLVDALVRHKSFGRGYPAAERETWARQIVTIVVDELIAIGQDSGRSAAPASVPARAPGLTDQPAVRVQ